MEDLRTPVEMHSNNAQEHSPINPARDIMIHYTTMLIAGNITQSEYEAIYKEAKNRVSLMRVKVD